MITVTRKTPAFMCGIFEFSDKSTAIYSIRYDSLSGKCLPTALHTCSPDQERAVEEFSRNPQYRRWYCLDKRIEPGFVVTDKPGSMARSNLWIADNRIYPSPDAAESDSL